ncbi:hypothetical protein [Nocardia sp. NPDC003979]
MTADPTPFGGGSGGGPTGPDWPKISGIAAVVAIPIAILAIVVQCATNQTPSTADTSGGETPVIVTTTTHVGQAEPKPSQDRESAQPKQGDFTLTDGESVDLESGSVGIAVPNNDLSFSSPSTSTLQYLYPSSGAIAEISSGADQAKCSKRLDDGSESKNLVESGEAYCLRTAEGNMVALQVVKLVSYPKGGVISMHYILWEQ